MKLIVQCPNALMIDLVNGEAIAALAGAVPVTSEGWGKDKRWIPSDDSRVDMELVADDIIGKRVEQMARLLEERQSAEKRWLEQYQAAQTAIKERDALKTQLDELKAKISG